MQNSEMEIIVTSCDDYADVWDPFFLLFKKYWADCIFKINLVTNSAVPSMGSPAAEVLKYAGETVCFDLNWAQRMLKTLDNVSADYVMLLCEDFLLCDKVDNDKITHYISVAEKYHAGCVYLGGVIDNPFSKRKGFSEDDSLLEYEKDTAYRISVYPAIWNKHYLRCIIESGCVTIWDFERLGSFYSNRFDERVLCSKRQEFPFEYGVFRGKWENAAIKLCDRCGIGIDFNKRLPMSDRDYIQKYLKSAILKLNPTLITKIQNVFR